MFHSILHFALCLPQNSAASEPNIECFCMQMVLIQLQSVRYQRIDTSELEPFPDHGNPHRLIHHRRGKKIHPNIAQFSYQQFPWLLLNLGKYVWNVNRAGWNLKSKRVKMNCSSCHESKLQFQTSQQNTNAFINHLPTYTALVICDIKIKMSSNI